MARLPTPGSDNGVWGTILNDFLSVEHNADGTLKSGGSLAGKIDKSTATTKGDLLVATAASTLARLGVGSNGQRLVADSTQTSGIAWASDDVIRATDFGAKFDGSTDDASALQSAITAAIAAGKPLFLAPGTTVVGTTLSIPSPITILGSGRETTTVKAKNGLNNYIFAFTAGAGVRVQGAHFADFKIDGNGSNQTGGGGIKADGAVQCSFERLHVTNPYDWGLKLGPMSGGAFGHHNRVFSCLFDQTVTPGGFGGGIWMTSSDENWLLASDFEGLGGSSNPVGSSPVMVYDQAGLQHIIACNFVGGTNNCISIRVQNALKTKIIGSTFDGTAGDSIFLVANKCVVTDNLVTSPGDAGTGTFSGIHLEFNTHFNVVTGNSLETSNTVVGHVRSLIREEGTGGSGDNLIEGNSVTWGVNGPTVALIESGGTNTIVRNNVGFVTEKAGTATVANGSTSVVVNHGLDMTPALSNITLTPTNSLGTAAKFWVSNVTSTQFTVNVNADPGATTATFSWFARM
jgi:hypothetical protein